MSKLFSLDGRVALVTGGSRGIGRMIAAGFLTHGAKVYISARHAEACDAAAAELSALGLCVSLPADVSGAEGIAALAAAFAAREPALDILVNNAGAAWGAPFDEFPEKGWDKVVDLNLKSPFFLTQALHGALIAGAKRAPAKSWACRAWVRKKGDFRLRLTTLSQPLSGNSSNAAPQAAPALLTRMSSLDSWAPKAATSSLIPAAVETSAGSEMQGPIWLSSAAVASQAAALRAEM